MQYKPLIRESNLFECVLTSCWSTSELSQASCVTGRGHMLPHPHVKKCLSYCIVDLVPVMYSILAINTICGCEMPLLLHLNQPQKSLFFTLYIYVLLPFSVVTKISSGSSEKAERRFSEGMGVWVKKTSLESILDTCMVTENQNPS